MNPDNLIKMNRLRSKELDNELSCIYFLRSLKEAKSKETHYSHNYNGALSVFSLVLGIAREAIRLNSTVHDSYDNKLNVT